MSTTPSEKTAQEMVQTLRPAWTVERMEPAEPSTDAVYHILAETDGESIEAVLKVCTATPPPDFRPEPYLCQLLGQQTSIPVPRIYGIVDTHEQYPAPFYLMERCEGCCGAALELASEQVTQIARTAGRHIGEYHTVGEFRRFGRLRLDCDVTQSRMGVTVDGRGLAVADAATGARPEPDTSLWRKCGTSSWRAWVESLYRYWMENFDERFSDLRPEIEAFIETRIDTLNRCFDAVLSHIDYKYRNILVRPETAETTAVIDWGHATVVEPYYDLVVTEHHLSRWASRCSPDRRRVRTALEEGYAQTNTFDRDGAFERRRELYLLHSYLQPLVWFSEWLTDASEAERNETERRYRRFVSAILD